MSLLTAKFVKNSRRYARIYFIFLENDLKQTWSAFNTKLRTHLKKSEKQL